MASISTCSLCSRIENNWLPVYDGCEAETISYVCVRCRDRKRRQARAERFVKLHCNKFPVEVFTYLHPGNTSSGFTSIGTCATSEWTTFDIYWMAPLTHRTSSTIRTFWWRSKSNEDAQEADDYTAQGVGSMTRTCWTTSAAFWFENGMTPRTHSNQKPSDKLY